MANNNKENSIKENTIATPNHTPHLDAFKSVVSSRRSVRIFTDTPISDDVLDDCLRLPPTQAIYNLGNFMSLSQYRNANEPTNSV